MFHIKVVFLFLIKCNRFLFLFIFSLLCIAIGFLSVFFPDFNDNDLVTSNISFFEELLMGGIIGPIIETLIFQSLIITIVKKTIKHIKYNYPISILLSAILFSLNHNYNNYYITITFIGGLILATAYYTATYRDENATIMTFLIHSIFNITSIIINYIYYLKWGIRS